MERIEIEAVEDRARAEGGHAVILLRGVTDVNGSGRFRLRALDDQSQTPAQRAIFEQIHDPIAVRPTSDGIALEIGPGLADSPLLLPGMALELTLIATGRTGEFLWPIVTPLARPKRRNIMMRRSGPDAATTGTGSPPPRTTTQPVPSVALPAELLPVQSPQLSGPPLPRLDITQPTPTSDATVSVSTTTAVDAHAEPSQVGVATPTTKATTQPKLAGTAIQTSPTRSEEFDTNALTPSLDKAPIADATQASSSTAASIVPTKQPEQDWQTSQAGTHIDWGELQQEPASASPEQLPPNLGRKITPASAALISAAILMAGQFIAINTLDLRLMKRTDALAAPQAVPSQPPPTMNRQQAGGIFELLATGPSSPRGLLADGVSPARALELAHLHQHGLEAERDREEAVYWLKRYVRSTVGTEPQRIALTQLGSAYASPSFTSRPDGKRNLAKAMKAWELAGALGDTVAICFLATLHAQGIGVPSDQVQADLWLSRAADAQCALPPNRSR